MYPEGATLTHSNKFTDDMGRSIVQCELQWQNEVFICQWKPMSVQCMSSKIFFAICVTTRLQSTVAVLKISLGLETVS